MKKKSLIKYIIVLFVLLSLFVYIFIINHKNISHKNIYKSFKLEYEIPKISFYNKESIKDITFNKVIVIGDSRMQRLRDRGDTIEIPINFSFIAKGGAKIDWFKTNAIKQLVIYLDNMDKQYKYHVVINMGVNDLEDSLNFSVYSDAYYKLYNDLIKKYNNVNFYFLSVNPIIEKTLNDWQPWSYRTNEKIKRFNDSLNFKIKVKSFNNYYYCNSNDFIDFKILDGIHYDKKTDQSIINYIVNDCLKY